MAETRGPIHWRELVLLCVILAVATVLRSWRLNSVPPGLTHDEAGHGQDAIRILDGARPIYATVGYGREPLYDYWVAGLMAIAGRTRVILRASAVPLGVMTILATFAWTRLAHGGAVALVSTALQTVSFWSLSTGRQALRSSLLPLLFTLTVYFYWRFVQGKTKADEDNSTASVAGYGHLAMFALLVGASLYTYVPARVLWIIFPAFLLYLALFHRTVSQRVAYPTLAGVGLGLLLAVPLFAYLRAHPGAEQRLAMLDAPLQALMRGDVSLLLRRAAGFVSGLFIPGRGDDFLAYTIPGRPIFDPPTGILFLVGLGLCLSRWRQPAYAFSLLWLLVGVSPSLVTGASASTTRSIAALPVVFLFPALAAVRGAKLAAERWGALGSSVVAVGFAGVLVWTGMSSAVDYFDRWAGSPHTRAAYRHTLVETAQYLDAQPAHGLVCISTHQPYAPHDPYVFDLSLRRQDLSLCWFDAREALLFRPGEEAWLITPSSAPLAATFAELPGLRFSDRVDMRANDLDPSFTVYEWLPGEGLAALRKRTADGVVTSSPAPAASTAGRGQENARLELIPPVNFGDALHFLGYELRTPVVAPGGTVALTTLWQAVNPGLFRLADPADIGGEPVVFVHALDTETGELIAQEDRLDAPAWDWQEGDVIAQSHSVVLPRECHRGLLNLAVGVYRRVDLARLPVVVEDVSAARTGLDGVIGDAVFLQPVEVQVR